MFREQFLINEIMLNIIIHVISRSCWWCSEVKSPLHQYAVQLSLEEDLTCTSCISEGLVAIFVGLFVSCWYSPLFWAAWWTGWLHSPTVIKKKQHTYWSFYTVRDLSSMWRIHTQPQQFDISSQRWSHVAVRWHLVPQPEVMEGQPAWLYWSHLQENIVEGFWHFLVKMLPHV